MKKEFPAKLSELENVQAFVDEALEEAGCSMKAVMRIDICLEELFVNIASYAYPDGEGTAEVEVTTDAENKATVVTLTDTGVQFNPLAKKDPDISLSAEERRIGGLGIYMVKNMMDGVSYERRDGKNIIKITNQIA